MKKSSTLVPYAMRRKSTAGLLSGLAVISVFLVFLCCSFGSARYGMGEIIHAVRAKLAGEALDGPIQLILFQVRLPRALMAYTVGAALSVSGVCMQGVFRNPMADPHILGVSSGAALGAALAMVFNLTGGVMGISIVPLGAFLGGAASVVLVLSLSKVHGRTSMVTLLLSGIAVSTFLSAVLSGLLTLNHDKMESVYLWTMGSFAASNWTKLSVVIPVVLIGFVVLRIFARDLNALMMGEDEARTLGVSVARIRIYVLGITTLMTAAAVSFSGIIGFVGLMVPHTVRMVTGPDHRVTLPASLLSGGIYLMLMDTLARTVFMPTEVPVGVLTALVGGPFFLILLKKSGGKL